MKLLIFLVALLSASCFAKLRSFDCAAFEDGGLFLNLTSKKTSVMFLKLIAMGAWERRPSPTKA